MPRTDELRELPSEWRQLGEQHPAARLDCDTIDGQTTWRIAPSPDDPNRVMLDALVHRTCAVLGLTETSESALVCWTMTIGAPEVVRNIDDAGEPAERDGIASASIRGDCSAYDTIAQALDAEAIRHGAKPASADADPDDFRKSAAYDAFGGAATFCLGMARSIRDLEASDESLLQAMRDLESMYWGSIRDAIYGTVTTRLNAINRQPACYGAFMRPNAHLICFDYARCVLEAIWAVGIVDVEDDWDAYQKILARGMPENARIDFTKIKERWSTMIDIALISLDLPDDKAILAAVQQEAARLASGTDVGEHEQQNPTPSADAKLASGGNIDGMPVDTALRRAEQHVKRSGWPGRNALAQIVGCSPSTITKAKSKSHVLKQAERKHRAEKAGAPREVSFTDIHAANLAQSTEADPADSAESDELTKLVREQAAEIQRDERQYQRAQKQARSRD